MYLGFRRIDPVPYHWLNFARANMILRAEKVERIGTIDGHPFHPFLEVVKQKIVTVTKSPRSRTSRFQKNECSTSDVACCLQCP